MDPPRRRSLLERLGSEILAVMLPVSLCMLLVVLLVSLLSSPPSAASSPPPPTAATLVYQESAADPPARRLEGALLNSLVFVLLVAGVTFLLLLLYYLNCSALLRGYMRFSAFLVLSSMGGPLLLALLRLPRPPLDAPTFLLLLFNLSALAVPAVLSASVPILLRQSYMLALAVVVAAYLTRLPEWTTWTLLLSLAVYDLVAVLSPAGPLKLLVDLAASRDDDLPAFVYEARPEIEFPPVRRSSPIELVGFQANTTASSSASATEEAPLVRAAADREEPVPEEDEEEEEGEERGRGIKLGLGDFVFYSVLVGRAAMYDWMTVYACYLAVAAGLGCTLTLLSVFRKALPALPISITLGVAFYFLTRLLLEPLVVGCSTSLLMF